MEKWLSDIDDVIVTWVAYAKSPEEAIALVDEDVEKGKCIPYEKRIRDRVIRILFARKPAAALAVAA